MRRTLSLLLVLLLPFPALAQWPTWKAGTATQVITPGPMWMAGYAGRKAPADGKLHDLWAKALALEAPDGGKVVLVTTDLCGIGRELSEEVAALVKKKTGLPRERLMLTVSHTHSGPVTRDPLLSMYDMPAAERAKIGPYTEKLRDWLASVAVRAVEGLKPATVEVGMGQATFAVNRRKPTPKGFVNDANPLGPVDHDVPVLRVTGPAGELRAVVFGYACHNTTLDGMKWSGDYAGFAMAALEKQYPGSVALFWSGCGGDANPLPRRTVALCQGYGEQLARSVTAVVERPMRAVGGSVSARYRTLPLTFASVPDRKQLSEAILSRNFAFAQRARNLMAILDKGGTIDPTYPHYPVQVWRLGGEVVWVALGGEVVVDYSHRLKKELAGPAAVWVTAYANDVMAYIPSERVLKEGGYEGESSMVYYGRPSRWAAGLEGRIVAAVHALVKEK